MANDLASPLPIMSGGPPPQSYRDNRDNVINVHTGEIIFNEHPFYIVARVGPVRSLSRCFMSMVTVCVRVCVCVGGHKRNLQFQILTLINIVP